MQALLRRPCYAAATLRDRLSQRPASPFDATFCRVLLNLRGLPIGCGGKVRNPADWRVKYDFEVLFVLDRAEFVMRSLGLDIGQMRFLWRIERSKLKSLSRNGQRRLPLSGHSSAMSAKKPCLAIGLRCPSVLLVLRASGFAQVCEAVVLRIAVDVVNLRFWKRSSDKQPSDSMGAVVVAINAKVRIALVHLYLNRRPFFHAPLRRFAASEHARLLVVVQKLLDAILGELHFAARFVSMC